MEEFLLLNLVDIGYDVDLLVAGLGTEGAEARLLAEVLFHVVLGDEGAHAGRVQLVLLSRGDVLPYINPEYFVHVHWLVNGHLRCLELPSRDLTETRVSLQHLQLVL